MIHTPSFLTPRMFGRRVFVSAETVLPQYLAPAGVTLLEDMETITGWTAVNGVRALDTTHYKSGAASIALTNNLGAQGFMTKTVSYDPATIDALRFRMYVAGTVDNHTDDSNLASIVVYLSQGNFAAYWLCTRTPLWAGWNVVNLPRAAFSAAGASPNWTTTIDRLRFRVIANTGTQATVSFDTVEALPTNSNPAVMLVIDDCLTNTYTEAYAYCHALGVPMTAYAISDLIDTAGFCTSAQLQEMDAGGWDIGNHTKDHTDFLTLTQAQIETEVTACQSFLDGLGLSRASKHVAYPYGGYDADTLAAMTGAGMLTGRATVSAQINVVPPNDNYYYSTKNIANTTTLAQAKAFVDLAVTQGGVVTILLHSLVASPSVDTEWAISDFRALVDYILAQHVQPLTVSQFYALQSGAISVPALW